MIQGVYIGQSETGDYDLVSTGDYVNPISPTFRLKDRRKSIEKIIPLVLIVNDIEVEFIRASVVGELAMIRCFLSWDQTQWSAEITKNELIEATGMMKQYPVYLKIIVDDFLDYFSLTGENVFKQYKIKVIYV